MYNTFFERHLHLNYNSRSSNKPGIHRAEYPMRPGFVVLGPLVGLEGFFDRL